MSSRRSDEKPHVPAWVNNKKHRYIIEPRGNDDGTDAWVWVVGESMRPEDFDSADCDFFSYIRKLENLSLIHI